MDKGERTEDGVRRAKDEGRRGEDRELVLIKSKDKEKKKQVQKQRAASANKSSR